MARVMITGANRGIGLELTRLYLARGDSVVATYRDEGRSQELLRAATELPDRLFPVNLEVRDDGSIGSAFSQVSSLWDGLDLLVNNAGVGDSSVDEGDPRAHRDLGELRSESLLTFMSTNAVGPVMVTQQFLPLLERGRDPKVALISSQMGSIARRGSGGHYAYCASKAALNMLGRVLAFDLRPQGIVSVLLHPGWARTSMGGPDATVSVEESAQGLVRVIDALTMEHTGRFFDHTGAELPW